MMKSIFLFFPLWLICILCALSVSYGDSTKKGTLDFELSKFSNNFLPEDVFMRWILSGKTLPKEDKMTIKRLFSSLLNIERINDFYLAKFNTFHWKGTPVQIVILNDENAIAFFNLDGVSFVNLGKIESSFFYINLAESRIFRSKAKIPFQEKLSFALWLGTEYTQILNDEITLFWTENFKIQSAKVIISD